MAQYLSISLLPPVVTVLTGLYVAFMGLYRVREKMENILFPVLCLLWIMGPSCFLFKEFASSRETVYLIELTQHFIFPYIPVLHIMFFHKLLGVSDKKTIIINFGIAIVLSAMVFSEGYINGFFDYSWGTVGKAGPLVNGIVVYGLVMAVYVVLIVSREIGKQPNNVIRAKVRYTEIGFVLSSMLTLMLIVPMRGIDLYPPGNFIFIPLGILGYGLLRYRILGVRTIVRRTVILAVSTLIVSIPNYGLFVFVDPYFISMTSGLYFGFMVILFFVNFHVVYKFQGFVRRRFEKNLNDLNTAGLSFFEDIVYLRNIPNLTEEFKDTVQRSLGFIDTKFYISSKNPTEFTNIDGDRLSIPQPVQERFLVDNTLIERHMIDELRRRSPWDPFVVSLCNRQNADYILPLVQHGKLIGLVFMTDNAPDRLLTKSEVRFIDQLGGFLSVALYNSLVYQDISELKDKLEEKTRELTEEITEREKAEKILETNRAQYRLLAENVRDLIWVMRVDDLSFSYLSPSVTRLLGYELADFETLKLKDILTPASFEYVKKVRENLLTDQRFALNEPLILELEHIRKDGTHVWMEILSHTLTHEAGADIIGVSRDITERKKADTEKKKLEAKLLKAQKMESIGILAGGIAHDFNNILMSILGYTHLAKAYVPPENTAAHEKLSRIEKSSNRAKVMVAQILAFSRQTEMTKLSVQITPIVSDALNLLNPTLPPNVTLIQDFRENLKPVVADPVHIHQVVLNLCTNAIHAMETGGGKFRVGVSEVKLDGGEAAVMNVKSGCYICLDVEDSGIGMDSKTLEKIFDPYFTTKEFGKGAGMGLAVVHGIVHGCGGAIRVESTPGKGSLFRIFLPCAETLIIHDVSEDPVDKGTERILFVDDDPDIAELAEETLGGMGYRMTIALSGSDALALFQKDPSAFDLMITDLTMPDMSGEDLAEMVHSLREDLPVILCTGYNSYTPDKDSKKTGIRDILIKPVHSVDLAESIRSVLTELKHSGETSSVTKECLH